MLKRAEAANVNKKASHKGGAGAGAGARHNQGNKRNADSDDDGEEDEEEEDVEQDSGKKGFSREEHKDVGKYINKQRTLILSTRGISHRDRHLLTDLRDLLPHSKKDIKFDDKGKLYEVNEVAELKSCNNTIFFEARKHKDLYLWISRCPQGPSIKFLVQNVHTMAEIKLTGNCLKGSRPIVCFDKNFDAQAPTTLIREVISQAFGAPKGHPKVKPFIDHVFSFFYLDGRIWFRNYQVAHDANADSDKEGEPVLVEIGPRFCLLPIRIFAGSFGGATLWENNKYVSPNVARAALKKKRSEKYDERQTNKKARAAYTKEHALNEDELADVFA